jgi:hypothetical protein
VWVNGVDKGFQQKQGAPEDIGKQTEELSQPMDDCLAEEIARRKAEVENVRRKVEEVMHDAGDRTMTKWKAEVQERADEEERAAELKAKAEVAKCNAEAAEREAEAARVVVLEAVSGLEKAAASEIVRAACSTARRAKLSADNAREAAKMAAKKAPGRGSRL